MEFFRGQLHCGLWDGIFDEFWSHSILFFFCILYSFFMFCATVSNNCDVLLKVKMKTLFERCLSNYTLMEIFSVFCLTFCEIFCKFLCFFFVGLLYTLLINNLLITTTDTYRLYISNTFYCNKQ